MKKPKPQLEWKLAYFENGKRRDPVTEDEDRELDEIIKEHEDGRNAAVNWAEIMIEAAQKWSVDSNKNIRILGTGLRKDASDLLSRIADGRGYEVQLISCLSNFEFYQSVVASVERKNDRTHKARDRMQAVSRSPNKRVGDLRFAVLKKILERTNDIDEINKSLKDLPDSERRLFHLPLKPNRTYKRYRSRYLKEKRSSH